MTILITIHGNGATPLSFEFLKAHIVLDGIDSVVDLSYTNEHSFQTNLFMMSDTIRDFAMGRDVIYLTHSLGACYAAYLADEYPNYCRGGVTISPPWGGSSSAYMMQLLDSSNKVYRDIAPSSDMIIGLRNIKLPGKWTSILSTSGHSNLIPEDNDGVLSWASMQAKEDVEYVAVSANHYEVMMSKQTVGIVNNALDDIMEIA